LLIFTLRLGLSKLEEREEKEEEEEEEGSFLQQHIPLLFSGKTDSRQNES
jgi:hypothetical protein